MSKKIITTFLSGKINSDNNHFKIKEMIELFPYCETIRKIDVLIKNRNEDITFEETLTKTALYSSNRKSLFLLILKESDSTLFNKIHEKGEINLKTKLSFQDWLKSSTSNNINKKVSTGNKAKTINYNKNTDDLMTETLAKLYIEQGHFDQALRAYQILRLKYPKKSSLFATEIKKINKLKLNNK